MPGVEFMVSMSQPVLFDVGFFLIHLSVGVTPFLDFFSEGILPCVSVD